MPPRTRERHTARTEVSQRPAAGLRPPLRSAAALAVVGVLALLAVSAFTVYLLDRRYGDQVVADAERALEHHGEMVRVWLERYRTLAPLYARDERVLRALRAPDDPVALAEVNRELEIWNGLAGTADTYVMDADGLTIAASNWADEPSFVGDSYTFRPYYIDAMRGRLGRFFGLGRSSGLRGYYFGAPVREAGEIIGVVVVKIAIHDLEQNLRLATDQIFVADTAGVVLLAGNPAFRLTRLGPLTAEARERIRATKQFELDMLDPAPLTPAGRFGDGTHALVRAPSDRQGNESRRFLRLTYPLLAEGWELSILVDTAPVRAHLWSTVLTAAAIVLVLVALAFIAWQRRRLLIERLAARERDRAVLERRVAERTADLRAANLSLEAEVAERRAAEETLRQTQAELVEAGKLAALGQMSAGLSHEFNQPLTAIRTYCENAVAFIEAGAGARAADNLARVMRLTERMAQLSKHLTRFARRSKETVAPIALAPAIAEALGLLNGRIERAGAEVALHGNTDVVVMGGTVRLQHVIMNLVANALDAVPEGGEPRIAITVIERGAEVDFIVDDNGEGIGPEVLPKIFDPFFTTKEVGKGVGLGLSISFNIVGEFGGRMRAENRQEGGARLTVTLIAAPADAIAA